MLEVVRALVANEWSAALKHTCCRWFLGPFGHLTVSSPGFQDARRSVPSSAAAPSGACVREDSWRSASRRCFKGERPAAANQEPLPPNRGNDK